MIGKFQQQLKNELASISEAGLFKKERIIIQPQSTEVEVYTGEKVLNFCANNYLGLSSHPEVVKAAKDALDTHGFGMSSVRFICGTQDIHKQLEKKISSFLKEPTISIYKSVLARLINSNRFSLGFFDVNDSLFKKYSNINS